LPSSVRYRAGLLDPSTAGPACGIRPRSAFGCPQVQEYTANMGPRYRSSNVSFWQSAHLNMRTAPVGMNIDEAFHPGQSSVAMRTSLKLRKLGLRRCETW
jgi:hypothetical protein